MKRSIMRFGLLILLSLCSFTATATPVLWTLSNVSASGGGSVTGSFVFDADISTVTNVVVQISGATPSTLNSSLTAGDSFSGVIALHQTPATNNPGVWLGAALSNAGGSVALGGLSFLGLCITSDCSGIQVAGSGSLQTLSGSVIGTPVASAPEAATLALLGLGLAGIAVARRRKLK